ncbi:hypothetical protein TRIUR3_13453 [Triticum urartu]|uniref:Uncharacterized protein n=1 Tax=Triticum urartu TaxID=4572 RepID=M7ZQQ4_TRIUA|nr:hypothetical protein TRIUR3_13453 [Triticum urartu]
MAKFLIVGACLTLDSKLTLVTNSDEELSAVLLSSLLGEKRMVLGHLVELSGKEESGPNDPYPTKGLKKEEQTEGHVA